MTNKELEQKISNAFEQATPDILDSIMADCKKQSKTMIRFKSNTASWNKKFAISVAAAVLVICFAFGWNLGIFRVGPALPTDPFGTGTQPSTDYQPSYPISVEWQMFASVVTADGTVVETFPMSIKGEIKGIKSRVYLSLEIVPEEDFRYIFSIPKPDGDICTNRFAQWPGDFTTEGFCYDKITNSPAWLGWAVNTEKEYFIGYWGEDFGYYLVASVDANVKPEEILEHFELFVDSIIEPKEPEPTEPKLTEPIPTEPQPTEPQPTEPEPTEPKPTEPKPTEPITPDGFPADLNMDVNVVRDFQDRFGYMTWSAQALGQYYDDPRDLVLRNFFYGVQFEDEAAITDDERAAIVAMTEIDDYYWMDGARFPVEKMNQLLNEMFGISLDDMNDRAFSSMHYLESTDSYYYFSGGSKTADLVSVVGTRTLENGNIEVYYLIGQPDSMDRDRAVVTLKPNGDGYLFISNKLL